MSWLRKVVCSAVLAAWTMVVLASGRAAAESTADRLAPRVPTTQEYWQPKVLRPGEARQTPPRQAAVQSGRLAWSSARPAGTRAPVRAISGLMRSEPLPLGDDMMLDPMGPMPGEPDFAPLPMDEGYGGYGVQDAYGGCETCDPTGGCSCGTCDTCGDCIGGACGAGYPECWWGPLWAWRRFWQRQHWWLSNISVFGGVHGFKGVADQGRNGNFGFHEGVNFGAALGGPCNLGYQLGVQVVHSDFSGHQAAAADVIRGSDRDQVFFTGGLFKRAPCGGLQGGVVFDLLHDRYYSTANLRQIRTESALVFSCGMREIGFWGAFGVGDDTLNLFDGQFDQDGLVLLKPTDTYSLFYRRHFSGGGHGRAWAGISGGGDALIGADCAVPLGTNWALENSFTYLIPKEGHGAGGQQEETWNVSIHLVWYPCRPASCAINGPFHPLFRVADNGLFLLNARQ